MHSAQRLINHVALVLDGSSSMSGHRSNLIKVADDQIRHLALRSEELQQETRVSVYLFADRVKCLIFDMDVMRLPSIADLYRASGMTALIDAALKSQEDLATTSQIYGDHAFLTFVLTDGQENHSSNSWTRLSTVIEKAAENWTIGFLVPNANGEAYMQRIGVPKGNIAQWNTAAANGIADAVSTIKTATDNFMSARATGVRGTRSVFSTGSDAVNKATVSTALDPIKKYTLLPVHAKVQIRDFVQGSGLAYRQGVGYYQLTKREEIQPAKKILVMDKKTGSVYGGDQARSLIGLPSRTVKVSPNYNPDYDIYVQSTSVNRVLLPGTNLVVLN